MAAKLQHQLVGRADLGGIADLAGKRVAVNRQGDITTYQVRYLVEYHRLPDVTLLSLGRESDRLTGNLTGVVDASVLPIPIDIVAERQGLKVLLAMSDLLEVPLGGLGASDERMRHERHEIAALVRGSIRGVQFLREPVHGDDVTALIASWIDIPREEARLALEPVRDTYSQNGMATEAGMRSFLAMLRATDATDDATTAEQVADFRIARQVAAELGVAP